MESRVDLHSPGGIDSEGMHRDVFQLEAEAQQLPPEDRARLARRLIATLDAGDDDAGQPWLDDAGQRLATYRPG